jgi:hypothetical protein
MSNLAKGDFGIILAKMKPWDKQEIEIAGGAKVLAQTPVIVSASRSTDVPAFYSDWFIERLEAGYVKWYNPYVETTTGIFADFNAN